MYTDYERISNKKENPNGIELLQKLSTACLLPFAFAKDLEKQATEVEQKAPLLTNLEEWQIAKVAIHNKNFTLATMQISACVKILLSNKA